MLGNLLSVAGFDYESSEAVRDELRAILGTLSPAATSYTGQWTLQGPVLGVLIDVPMYQTDPIVRRATALQQTHVAARPLVAY